MTSGPWWDNAAIVVVAVVCVGLIARRLWGTITKGPSAGCGTCSKCGPGGGHHESHHS